uniref:Uncharacterized protein n=1 Tax=Panagrolaimus davidi TaxID=227884 RepID=A0A914Q8D4_9BILA
MVDCGVKVVRSKCGDDMVKQICKDLPTYLQSIGSSCTDLTRSDNTGTQTSSCTEQDAINYIQNSCNIDINAPCSDAQSMVDCGIKVVRSKCGDDMVKQVCRDLPTFLHNIGSTCTNLKCSDSGSNTGGAMGKQSTAFFSILTALLLIVKLYLEKFLL